MSSGRIAYALLLTLPSRRCWILTFDSLGGFHKAVTNKLKGYLVSEAMSKLGKRPEELSIEQVQCGKADVSRHFVRVRSLRLQPDLQGISRRRSRNNRTTATAGSTCFTSSSASFRPQRGF